MNLFMSNLGSCATLSSFFVCVFIVFVAVVNHTVAVAIDVADATLSFFIYYWPTC